MCLKFLCQYTWYWTGQKAPLGFSITSPLESQFSRDKFSVQESFVCSGFWQSGESGLISKIQLPTAHQWAKLSWGSVKGNRWKEGYMQRQYSQLCHLEIDPQWSEQWASSCFKQLIFSSGIGLFPFLWGQFLWWWLFISCLQSGHHTILPLGGSFSIYKTTHRTWLGILSVALGRGTNGSWLCLMVKLLLFGFVWLLSFAYAVSLFFD